MRCPRGKTRREQTRKISVDEIPCVQVWFWLLSPLLSNDPEQMAKGHLLRACLFPFDWTYVLIEVKLEIVDIETSLAKTRPIFFPFVNGAIKELESQSVRLLVGGN